MRDQISAIFMQKNCETQSFCLLDGSFLFFCRRKYTKKKGYSKTIKGVYEFIGFLT